MKSDWVNPFLGSVIDVWRQEFDQSVQKTRLIPYSNSDSNNVLAGEVSIVFNLQGSINGVVLYEMDASTARKIASAKSGGVIGELDGPALNPIKSVINAIVKQAVFQLGEAGYKCRPTPPKVYQAPGRQFALRQQPPQVGVVFGSDFGEILVRVGLTESIEDTSNVNWLMAQSGLKRG